MSLIVNAIEPQKYELIRDRIGQILAVELPNQATLNNLDYLNASVYVDSTGRFDKTQLPAINVTLANGDFESRDALTTVGVYQFNIDVHVGSKSLNSDRGDKLALFKLQRLLGVCRAILEAGQYKRLGFQAPFCSYRQINSIAIADSGRKDAENIEMGRLVFEIRVTETVEAITPTELTEVFSQVKLEETEKGFLFVFN